FVWSAARNASLHQKTMPSLRYHDQNNNRYSLQGTQFHYDPIQPAQSSSGTYSGGVALKHHISDERSQEIFALATQIMQDSQRHTQQRRMMTAILSLQLTEDWQRATLLRSQLRSEFEGLLQAAREDA
ncbi:MAG: hypothetical protein AAFN10_13135, partial [Bacteroidota bacterium]